MQTILTERAGPDNAIVGLGLSPSTKEAKNQRELDRHEYSILLGIQDTGIDDA